MQSEADTPEAYLAELPEDRRAIVSAVREVILANLPDGYVEAMQYGMLSYVVPLETYPETYNGQALAYISLANQKQKISLYLMGVYADAETEFRQRFAAAGKKLDMGKSCVRFRGLDDLPLDVIADEVARVSVDDFIAHYEDARLSSKRRS